MSRMMSDGELLEVYLLAFGAERADAVGQILARMKSPQWQPMETAPLVDSKLLLGYGDETYDFIWWNEDTDEWINSTTFSPVVPSHWMALPPPPDEPE